MPSNNIIVLDSYSNLTNKSNLIGRLQYDLIRFFDYLVVGFSASEMTCIVSSGALNSTHSLSGLLFLGLPVHRCIGITVSNH